MVDRMNRPAEGNPDSPNRVSPALSAKAPNRQTPPIVDVSPTKWNIAHTTWFFEEMILKKYAVGYKVFDENFGFLFNSYYNSVGERTLRDHRGDLSRPTVNQVFEYRKRIDGKMTE